MKVFELSALYSDHGFLLSWHATREEAEAEMKEKIRYGADPDNCDIKEHDIPTDKAGLLEWLNIHLHSDNG